MDILELEQLCTKFKGVGSNVIVQVLGKHNSTNGRFESISPIIGKILEFGKIKDFPWTLTLIKSDLSGECWPSDSIEDICKIGNEPILEIDIYEDKLFESKASPFFWMGKAEELHYAGNILLSDLKERIGLTTKTLNEGKTVDEALKHMSPNISFIIDSLFGSSIEALLKGICIKKEPERYIKAGKLIKITTHDLNKLAELSKTYLFPKEIEFCDGVMGSMLNNARYPVPKSAKELDIFNSFQPVFGERYKTYEALYTRLSKEIWDKKIK